MAGEQALSGAQASRAELADCKRHVARLRAEASALMDASLNYRDVAGRCEDPETARRFYRSSESLRAQSYARLMRSGSLRMRDTR